MQPNPAHKLFVMDNDLHNARQPHNHDRAGKCPTKWLLPTLDPGGEVKKLI